MVRFIIAQNFFGSFGYETGVMAPKFINLLRESLGVATGAGLAIGLMTGIAELFIFPKRFYHKAFLILNLYKTIAYLISILLVAMLTLLIYKITTTYLNGIGLLQSVWIVLISNGFLHLLISGLFLSIGISLILSVQNKIGHNSFLPMIMGKYHKPKEENRIFLFIDLKSSSFTAEKLGHVKYSQLIQSCFRDLSDIAIKYNGEIYQFVGDEAVITWKAKNKNNFVNAVQLYHSFKSELEKKSHLYYYQYGVMPKFKGAIHSGKVMVAEVGGFLKTEIAYHGDVLNTAARMLEFCKPLHTGLLISEEIFDNIQSAKSPLNFSNEGIIKLRGKNKRINVYGAYDSLKERISASA